MSSEFKNNTLKGIKWSFINKLATQFLKFSFSLVLARLLSPDDFGLLAMIVVFSNFGQLFTDLGFGQTLIYKKDITKIEYDSIFVINIAIGITLSLLFFFGAPSIATFYDEIRLEALIKAFSIVFILQSFGIVNAIELRKKINFKRLTIITNLSFLISSAIAIVMAFLGLGVWSLIFRSLINITLRTILTFSSTVYRPQLRFNLQAIRELWRYSINIFGNGFLTYWMRNLDNLMIGKILGQTSLGFYNMAYQIMLFPIQNISNGIKEVLFPSFSSIKNDIKTIRDVYLKVIQTIALITFPLMAGISSLSDMFVLNVLGEKWIEIIPLLRLLALVAIPQSIFTVNGTIYLNTGRPDIPFKMNLISLPLYAVAFYCGLKYNGLMGLVYAYILTYGLLCIPIYYFSAKNINLKISRFMTKLFPIIFSTIIMYIILGSAKQFLFSNNQNILHFVILAFIGIISYTFSLLLFRNKLDIYRLLWKEKLLKNAVKKKSLWN